MLANPLVRAEKVYGKFVKLGNTYVQTWTRTVLHNKITREERRADDEWRRSAEQRLGMDDDDCMGITDAVETESCPDTEIDSCSDTEIEEEGSDDEEHRLAMEKLEKQRTIYLREVSVFSPEWGIMTTSQQQQQQQRLEVKF